METFSGYKCCHQLPWPVDSSPQTFPCVWRGCVHPVQLRWLRHFCPVCSRSLKEPCLAPVSLSSAWALGFCFHKFLLSIILFSILLREITGKFFIRSIKLILWFWQLQPMLEWKCLVPCTFHGVSELSWLRLVRGKQCLRITNGWPPKKACPVRVMVHVPKSLFFWKFPFQIKNNYRILIFDLQVCPWFSVFANCWTTGFPPSCG